MSGSTTTASLIQQAPTTSPSKSITRPSREKKLKLTVHPLPRFPDIVLALNIISTDPPRFHWYIFVPAAADAHLDVQSGLKMHATTDYSPAGPPSEGMSRWCFDATPCTLARSEGGLAAAAVIGRLRVDSEGMEEDRLRSVLAQIPMAVPERDRAREPVFTCRVWVREALRRMHAGGFACCPDVDAMEEEMWRYGRAAARAIEEDRFEVAALVEAVGSQAV